MKIVLLLAAYIIGSIPTAVWWGRWFYNRDIRNYGSGNAGATNTFRIFGSRAGITVLLIDALKGFAAVKLSLLMPEMAGDQKWMIVLGLVSVAGHIFPVLAQFRGGKGIATFLGVLLALHMGAALLAMATFILFFLSFRIVSLSSIMAAISFPLWLIFRFRETTTEMVIFGLALILIVLVTHQKNIERLLRGNERKISLRKNDEDHD